MTERDPNYLHWEDVMNPNDDDRIAAQLLFQHMKANFLPLFKPAFERIIAINSQYNETRAMTAQIGKTNLASVDMADRLLVTLTNDNDAQISFISTSPENGEYKGYSINSYWGTTEEFDDMIKEVVSASNEDGALVQQLKPNTVIFAGCEIT